MQREEGWRAKWDGMERKMVKMEKQVGELKKLKVGMGGVEKRIGDLECQKEGREEERDREKEGIG